MPIHDLSYRHWTGERSSLPPAWILGRAQLRSVLRRRAVRLLLFVGAVPFLAYLVIVWVEALVSRDSGNLPDFLYELAPAVAMDSDMLQRYLGWQRLLHVLLCIAAGADLVALDRRSRALQIYLARPLGVGEYLVGKAAPMLVLLSVTSWVPALLLVLLKSVATTDLAWLQAEPWIPWSILSYSVVLIVPLVLLTLAISSLNASPRMASAQLFVFVAISRAAAEILTVLTSQHGWRLLSVLADLEQVEAWLFRSPLPHDVSPWLALGSLALLSLGSVLVLRSRVRAVDIVGGS